LDIVPGVNKVLRQTRTQLYWIWSSQFHPTGIPSALATKTEKVKETKLIIWKAINTHNITSTTTGSALSFSCVLGHDIADYAASSFLVSPSTLSRTLLLFSPFSFREFFCHEIIVGTQKKGAAWFIIWVQLFFLSLRLLCVSAVIYPPTSSFYSAARHPINKTTTVKRRWPFCIRHDLIEDFWLFCFWWMDLVFIWDPIIVVR
jgi:hypothetical protein